ncbi:MAG TPA: hypothetical protein VL240_10200 [Candidatus Binatia bacterium]|nr:hypothetical protein [Candidatus Binatia bacterium]
MAKPFLGVVSLGRFRGVFRPSTKVVGLLACLCISALLAGAQTLPNDPQVAGAPENCAVSTAMFNGFFHSGTAAVDGVVDPANSVTFPNNTGLHNCDFYQWAQQMFLWLTSPAPPSYGGGGGRIFASPQFFTVTPADSNGKRTLISNQSMFSLLGPGLHFLGIRAAQVGVHGLPVIMSKSGQMFEVQPGPVSTKGKPLVLNQAGKQVEVESTAMRAGKLVLLDTTGKAITTPKLIVPKQIPQEQLQRLGPQQQQLPELAPQRELLMKLAPQHEVLLKPAAAHAQVLQKLQPAPVNPKLIAQHFVLNGKDIFLNVNAGVIETEEGQAVTNGVLIAQNGSLIYYITMVNDVMAYFLTGTKDTLLGKPGGITPAPTQFPTTSGDLAKITAFASAHSETFPDPNALAIEVKSSWIETTGLANPNQYITTQAVIPTYDKTDPNKWVPNGQKTATLALVGMHVVGSAKGHPEMIWATFEHFGNAPNAKFEYTSTSGTKTLNNPPTPVTGTWLFCATGSNGPFNQIHAKFSSPNIVGVGGAIGPSDVIRSSPFGATFGVPPNPLSGPTSAGSNDANSNSQIIGIDNSIQSDFAALSGGPDIRTNYYMTGATWTENGNPPTSSFPAGIDVGTSVLAGSTMETFQQPSNCFNCHGDGLPSVNLTVSHVTCEAGSNSNTCLNGIQPLF